MNFHSSIIVPAIINAVLLLSGLRMLNLIFSFLHTIRLKPLGWRGREKDEEGNRASFECLDGNTELAAICFYI